MSLYPFLFLGYIIEDRSISKILQSHISHLSDRKSEYYIETMNFLINLTKHDLGMKFDKNFANRL